jgi:UDP-galactose transporter B1
VAIGVLLTAFTIHFFLQEGLNPRFPTADDYHFPNTLPVWCTLFNVITALIILITFRIPFLRSPFPHLLVSIPQQAGAKLHTKALLQVDYPTLHLFTAAKPVAVLAMQAILSRRFPNLKRVVVVTLISVGFAVFRFTTIQAIPVFGAILAFVGVLCDAAVNPIVDWLKETTIGGPFVVMFYSQFWCMILLGVPARHEICDAVVWLVAHPTFFQKIMSYGVTGSIGTTAIFVTLGLTDGLVVSIATNFRKFLSILLSSVVYRHRLTTGQWIGVGVVFGALGVQHFWEHIERQSQKEQEDAKAE